MKSVLFLIPALNLIRDNENKGQLNSIRNINHKMHPHFGAAVSNSESHCSCNSIGSRYA